MNHIAFNNSVKSVIWQEREGSCNGLRARHEVSSFPSGLNRGLTWCSTPCNYKDDDAWQPTKPNKGGFPMKSFYLGIDVSKGYADFVIMDQYKKPIVKNFQIDDTFEGHAHLYDILKGFLARHPKSSLYAGLESTGGYENNWYKSLIGFKALLNIQTAHLNPLGVSHNIKADLERNGTDKISAKGIAEYLISHPEKVDYQKKDTLSHLKKLWGFTETLTKQKTQLKNQLQNLMYTANPELIAFCRDGFPEWILKLLLKYPTADNLKKARAQTLAKIPYISLQRAQELIGNAKRSVASSTDSVTAQIMSATTNQILQLQALIAKQRELMSKQCDMQEVEILKSFVGIGDISAISLMIEIQNIARFKSSKSLAAYWGLHPVYKQSGDGNGGFKMSKKGRKNPRKILYNVAITAINYNPVIKPLYEYHINKGRNKMSAIGVCMHKIVRIIFGMLKNRTAFNPEIDRKNGKRSLPDIANITKKSKDRRFQTYDKKAPVTRRQRKKRLEREPSQSVNNTKRGISAPVPLGVIITKILSEL